MIVNLDDINTLGFLQGASAIATCLLMFMGFREMKGRNRLWIKRVWVILMGSALIICVSCGGKVALLASEHPEYQPVAVCYSLVSIAVLGAMVAYLRKSFWDKR